MVAVQFPSKAVTKIGLSVALLLAFSGIATAQLGSSRVESLPCGLFIGSAAGSSVTKKAPIPRIGSSSIKLPLLASSSVSKESTAAAPNFKAEIPLYLYLAAGFGQGAFSRDYCGSSMTVISDYGADAALLWYPIRGIGVGAGVDLHADPVNSLFGLNAGVRLAFGQPQWVFLTGQYSFFAPNNTAGMSFGLGLFGFVISMDMGSMDISEYLVNGSNAWENGQHFTIGYVVSLF